MGSRTGQERGAGEREKDRARNPDLRLDDLDDLARGAETGAGETAAEAGTAVQAGHDVTDLDAAMVGVEAAHDPAEPAIGFAQFVKTGAAPPETVALGGQ